MSLQSIHLRKLLRLFYAPSNLRVRILRNDIRSELRKAAGLDSGGGDFHVPFWSDAKDHVFGASDLRDQVALRIASNKGRQRLYTAMSDGFLGWWNEKRRWRNEPLRLLNIPAKAQLQIEDVGGVVKIENIMGLESGPEFNRLIYPYFSEEPSLPEEGGRLGLWAMREALPTAYDVDDMRVLDILRSRTFTARDHKLVGNEGEVFLRRYQQLIADWTRLREEYS